MSSFISESGASNRERPHPLELTSEELFRFTFDDSPRISAGNVFKLHIRPVKPPARDEIWNIGTAISTGKDTGFSYARSDEHMLAHIEIDESDQNELQHTTEDAYDRLLYLFKKYGYKNLIRIWNCFPNINHGEGDQERYKLFNAGRASAIGKFGLDAKFLPAGTAIGTAAGTPFTISALATKRSCLMVENPRQISAYRYPSKYGSSRPSFSRAVVLYGRENRLALLSGTAAIVGHESQHLDDPEQQATETLYNLEALIDQVKILASVNRKANKEKFSYMRVYVRNLDHVDIIVQLLNAKLRRNCKPIFLQSDICRKELLLEVEAAYEF